MAVVDSLSMAKYTCIFEDTGSVDKYDRLRHIPEFVLLSIGEICHRLAVATKQDGEPVHILDAGAGTGRFALPCACVVNNNECKTHFLAVDLSARMLQQLQNNWKNAGVSSKLNCIQADIQCPLPIPKDSVHIIYTVATFHILDKWRKALDNLIQVLLPGGHLIFICENKTISVGN